MSGWRVTSAAITAGAAAALALAGCGGGSSPASNGSSSGFRIDVAAASFPATQHLAQHADMVLVIRNPGTRAIPNIAVTITDSGPGAGTGAQAFGEVLHAPDLAYRSRPVWILDQAPCPATASDLTRTGECAPTVGGVPQTGGPGGAVTAYSNTWAMGRLGAGRSATFRWGVTAARPGVHVIHYQVAAALSGKSRAVYGAGQPLQGTFVVKILSTPQQSYVNDAGKIVVVP